MPETSVKASILLPGELDAPLLQAWNQLQASDPSLGSPFFSARFIQLVSQVRPDLRVAVLQTQAGVAGFFPFHRWWGVGTPAAEHLSDHHGLVARPDTRWDWAWLLKQCRLGYWTFDHLCAWQRPPCEVQAESSPGLDLSGGFDAWFGRRRAAGARRVTELPRKARKLAREVGPLRFEAHTRDPAVLRWVLAQKTAQCRRTGARDCFAAAWARELVQRVAETDEPDFAGRLSALYAGDRLVAAHLGMRSRTVWHWWFPVYDHAFADWSPGALLLMEVAAAAARQQHLLLDLGKGDEAYKRSFADTALPVLKGRMERRAPSSQILALRKRTGRWLRSSPWALPARPLLRRIGRL